MATPPSFIQYIETTWNVTIGSGGLTTSSFSVQAGDILVAVGQAEDANTLSIAGGSLSWSLQQSINTAGYTANFLWTAVVDSNKSMTCTVTRTANQKGGLGVYTWRGSDGVGNSNKTNVASGAPSLSLTPAQANSAILVFNGDWSAADGTSRTWRTGAGTFTEKLYFRDSAIYTLYGGYHADAGAVAAKTLGLSAPSGQKYSITAIEVKGTAGGGGGGTAVPVFLHHMITQGMA